MKRIILIAMVVLTSFAGAACDICGCGVGNSYIGILPDFGKRVFGLRYRYNSIHSHVGVGGASTYLTTKEKFSTIEAWGGWNITPKFRVMASGPYSFNQKLHQGTTLRKAGIGDVSALAFYQVVNHRGTVLENKLLVQSLWFGGGVKLPTGKYNPSDKSSTNNNANLFQLGTGSTDYILSAMYDIRLQDAGLNINGAYRITTVNKYEYAYGNKGNINLQAYHKFRIKNVFTIAPNAGVQYETASKDWDNGLTVAASGGNLLLGTIGLETTFKKFSVGANFQTPLSQNLASGTVQANDRVMVHVSMPL